MTDLITYITLFGVPFIVGILVLQVKPKLTQNIKLFLSFSGAFLLATCILHLLPELYNHYTPTVGLFVLFGFVLQLFLEFSSQGIEHGHLHLHQTEEKAKFPTTIFFSLFIHSFIEGMALTHNHSHQYGGDSLLLAIIIHKVPIVIILATLLMANRTSSKNTIIAILIFCLSAPAGLVLSKLLEGNLVDNIYYLLAIVVGIFLHISTTILFESGDGHKFNLKKVAIIIIGFLGGFLLL